MSSDFIPNLRLLCSYYPSISEVCRKAGIGRQQFTKYLSGASFPSQRNLRLLCDFFGVDSYELLMPHDQFSKIVRLKPTRTDDAPLLPPRLGRMLAVVARRETQIRRYHGYYFKYFYSLSEPGMILRSLVFIYQFQEFTLYKTIERLRPFDRPQAATYIFKYEGILVPVGDRLHMIDHEAIMGNEISHSILYLPSRNRLSHLIGVMIGVSGTEAHQPAAVKVVLEFLGKTIDRKRALAYCGLLPPRHASIDSKIAAYIDNHIDQDTTILRSDVFPSLKV